MLGEDFVSAFRDGLAKYKAGEYRDAAIVLRQAVASTDKHECEPQLGHALMLLVKALESAGEDAELEIRDYTNRVIRMVDSQLSTKDSRWAVVFEMLAVRSWNIEELDEALRLFRVSLMLRESTESSRYSLAYLLATMASLLLEMQRPEEAATLVGRACELQEKLGDKATLILNLALYGASLFDSGQLAEAIAAWERALNERRATGRGDQDRLIRELIQRIEKAKALLPGQ